MLSFVMLLFFVKLLLSVSVTGILATTVRVGYIYSDEGLDRGLATFRFTERFLRKTGILADNVTLE